MKGHKDSTGQFHPHTNHQSAIHTKDVVFHGEKIKVKGTGISKYLHQSLFRNLQKQQAKLRLARNAPSKEFGGKKGKEERIRYLTDQVEEAKKLVKANTV